MVTYYVLFDPFSRLFVRAGHRGGYTSNISAAKHFTSEWSAQNFLKNADGDTLSAFTVKKIERY